MSDTNPRWLCPYCKTDVLVSRFYFHNNKEHPLQFWDGENVKALQNTLKQAQKGKGLCVIVESKAKKDTFLYLNPLNDIVYKRDVSCDNAMDKDTRTEKERCEYILKWGEAILKRLETLRGQMNETIDVKGSGDDGVKPVAFQNLLYDIYNQADYEYSNMFEEKCEVEEKLVEAHNQIKRLTKQRERFDKLVKALQERYEIHDFVLEGMADMIRDDDSEDEDDEYEAPKMPPLEYDVRRHKIPFAVDYETIHQEKKEEQRRKKEAKVMNE
jgi:hypothetical protein